MKTVHKAVAAVVRSTGHNLELLVFKHPEAGTQIPKGTVKKGETVERAALRELEEESGLRLEGETRFVGTWERVVGGGHNEDGPLEKHVWHVSILKGLPEIPAQWVHYATGSPAEDGLAFDFHWLAIDADLPKKLHPVFDAVSRMICEQVKAM